MAAVFVDADWLAANRDSVRVVDVRDAWEYDGIGHVPGAVNVPFDAFRADEPGTGDADAGGMLPGADVFADLCGDAGIAETDDVVAYDDTHGVFAARFLVTAELYGHDPDRLHLLDGDYSAWTRDHPTNTDPVDRDSVEYVVDRPADGPLVDRDAVVAALDDPDTVVVDTREPAEYDEGHLPGAVQFDWKTVVDDETRGLRPLETVRERLTEQGITAEKRVVLYCNTARRISHTYLVLRHLGFEDVGFYEGSLTEWRAADGALETGGPE
jgi:thiosulfate/3-mercaptopyruvate sulfurtransferase